MHIKELYKQVSNQRSKVELPPISEEQFLEEIVLMQIKGMLVIDGDKIENLKVCHINKGKKGNVL